MSEEAAKAGDSHTTRVYFLLRLLARWRPGPREQVFLLSIVVGIVGALAAIGFQYATHAIQFLLSQQTGPYVETFRNMPGWQRILVPTVGGLLAGLFMQLGRRIDRRKATDYMEAIALGNGDVPLRPSLAKSGAAMFSIAGGEAIGREGPLVQLSSVLASVLGRIFRAPPPRLRLLVACGAAAGIASAYNAPIAGALFVAEIILGSIAMESLGPLLLSSMAATLTTRTLEHPEPLYRFQASFDFPAQSIPSFLILGIACGLAAPLFIFILRMGRRVFEPLKAPLAVRLALGGLIMGIIAFSFPEVAGNGKSVIHEIIQGHYDAPTVGTIMAYKVLAVAAVFGSGAVGGVFTPSLLTGASLGFLVGSLANMTGLAGGVSPEVFALVGMGAFLSAAARAPVMAILMLFEMTLTPVIILPLMAAAVISYFIARSLPGESLYEETVRAGPRSVFDLSLGEIRIGQILRPTFPKVESNSRFGQVAQNLLRASEGMLTVTRDGDRLAGVILLEDVKPYLRDRVLADSIIASDIMRNDLPRLRVDQDLPEAMRIFANTSEETLPVVEIRDGTEHVRGTLDRSDLYLTISELTRRATAG